jgi:hypothetical protein
VAVYPVHADRSANVSHYRKKLTQEDFIDLETYFSAQAGNYGLDIQRPAILYLGHEIKSIPPALPNR